MPYKTGKTKGELTTQEIRKLIKAHNVLVSIKIPKGAKREEIIALVEKNGYQVNHEKQALVPKVEMQRKKTISLEKAKEITKPKPLTEEQKKKKQQAKQKKEGQKAFLKTVIPAPPAVSKPSKGVKVGKPPPKPKPKKEATTKPKKTKEEKLANRKKLEDIETRKTNLKRVKKVGLLVDAINQFNQIEVGKSLKKPLRTSNEPKSKLIEKIVAYDIDKVIDIDIPEKVERKKMTEDELLNKVNKRTKRNENTIKYGMFGLSLGEKNYERLHNYCTKHNLYKATLVRSLVVDYLDRAEQKDDNV